MAGVVGGGGEQLGRSLAELVGEVIGASDEQ